MDRSDVITLIDVSYVQDEIGQQIPKETERNVFCNVSSIGANEFYNANLQGLKPEYKVTVFAPDYNGESLVKYQNKTYSVYRTYRSKNEQMELYLQAKAGGNNA